ncbi:hypothetical protein M9458_056445 [Cirrhinus mrigala]|uniref:CCHC-type domain-containing protein n=1 Tax=Cirrhinus mrigala TaxID=683832 RepID=A0ABD0MGL4_CIRMR
MTNQDAMSFENLTRRHGVKVESKISVEQCCLAVGEIVGYDKIVSASRMNSATVLFLKSIEKANEVVQSGVVLNGSLVPVLPLSSPSKKVTFKSKFKIDGFDYTVFATSDITIKCFSCNKIGHLVREWPNKTESADASTSSERVVSAVSSAEIVGDTESAGMTAEVTEKEPGLVVADGIESNTTENDAKLCKSDTSQLVDGQFEQSESICVADIEEMYVEGHVVDFETEMGSVFKIPVKRKKKKAVERLLNNENVGSDSDENSSDSNLSQCSKRKPELFV